MKMEAVPAFDFEISSLKTSESSYRFAVMPLRSFRPIRYLADLPATNGLPRVAARPRANLARAAPYLESSHQAATSGLSACLEQA